MSTPNYDPKFASVKTYIMIAFIFTIISMVGWILGAAAQIVGYITFNTYSGFLVAPVGLLITGVVFLVFFVLTLLVFLRVRPMYTAANAGDIATLKRYNNMMWAILALIFAGVLPGIMLLISFGPINELGGQPMPQQGAYAPPPPPPSY